MNFKTLFSTTLTSALNQYLSLDDNLPLILQPLAGKVIALTIQPFNVTFYLCITDKTIICTDYFSGTIDTTITGSLVDLGFMSLSKNPQRSIYNGKVIINGDMEVARHFQNLFAQLDIRFEKKLSHFTGETVAQNVTQFFQAGKRNIATSIDTFQLNLSDFLTEESRDLPAKAEADIFYRQVDELRLDYDRLAARLARLLHSNQENL